MILLVNFVAIGLMGLGLAFMVVAAAGFMRLPDVFSRLHVTGVLDTLGAPLVLLGVAVWAAPAMTLVAGKLVLGLVFLLVSSPLIGHLLSRAALESAQIQPPPHLPTHTTADPDEARTGVASR